MVHGPMASQVAQMVRESAWNPGVWVQSLDWEDPLEKGMSILSSILAWRIPWMEEPGGLQSVGGHKQSDTTEWLSMHVDII